MFQRFAFGLLLLPIFLPLFGCAEKNPKIAPNQTNVNTNLTPNIEGSGKSGPASAAQ
jgi:hypothetical protein